MVHYCWVCKQVKGNEAFSRGGRVRHLCRDCAKLPQAERDRKDKISLLWELLLRQSIISDHHIQLVSVWAKEADEEVAALAQAVIEVGQGTARRRKRLSYLRSDHPALWHRMILAGLVDDLTPVEGLVRAG
jgi:hypothetical protein